jgi:calcineurin-like phosphoesterase family protein
MRDIYFCSDHHVLHSNILKFTDKNGLPIRPKGDGLFSCIEEHDQYLIDQHNSVVKPQDKAYFLGDFCINQKGLKLIEAFNGSKRLIRGNHDIFHIKEYLSRGFKEVYGVRVFTPKEMGGHFAVASHVPLHTSSLHRFTVNIHGHTHSNVVTKDDGSVDKRYICVCMEQLNDYKPIHIDEIIAKITELKKLGLVGEGSY